MVAVTALGLIGAPFEWSPNGYLPYLIYHLKVLSEYLGFRDFVKPFCDINESIVSVHEI